MHSWWVWVVWNEGTDVVRVSGVELPRVDSPMFSLTLIFTSSSGMVSISITAFIAIPVVALSVSFSHPFSFSFVISVTNSPFSLSQALFSTIIFSVILNFSALLGFPGFASILALGLLLVSPGHVPLGDWMAESLQTDGLVERVRLGNVVAQTVEVEVRIVVRSWHVEVRMLTLSSGHGRSVDRGASDVLVGTWMHLFRVDFVVLRESLVVVLVHA